MRTKGAGLRDDATRIDDATAKAASLLGDLATPNEPVGARTTYRVGGAAALFVEIEDEETLERVMDAVVASEVEVLVLGKGSNLLVADSGFSGLCVSLGESFDFVRIDNEAGTLEAGGNTAYPVLARRSAAAGLCGMEWAVGVPGSVGGAVRMNAGGHGSQTGERLVSARLVDLSSGEQRDVAASDLDLGYRRSAVNSKTLVCTARFALEHGDLEHSAELLGEIVHWRRAHQPGGRNAGSVFTNPAGDAAGRLVDQAGLKGLRRGSAQVSVKHANFILADEDGSADDVYGLICEVQGLVASRLGVELVTELRLIGFGR